MSEEKLFLNRKIFIFLTLIVGLITGFLSFLATLVPLFEISGVVRGIVALSWYNIVAFNRRIFLSTLDTLSFLSIIVNIVNFFVIFSSLISLALILRRIENYMLFELPFASSLVYIMYSGLLLGIFRVLHREILTLSTVYREITSAGILFTGESHVHETVFSKIFFPIIPLPLIMGFTYLAFSSIVMINYLRSKAF